MGASRGIFEVSEAHHDFLFLLAMAYFSSEGMPTMKIALDFLERGDLTAPDARGYRDFVLAGLNDERALDGFVKLIFERGRYPNAAFWAAGILEQYPERADHEDLKKIVAQHTTITSL